MAADALTLMREAKEYSVTLLEDEEGKGWFLEFGNQGILFESCPRLIMACVALNDSGYVPRNDWTELI